MSDSDKRFEEEQPVRVTDKRRLDPESGEVRPPAGPGGSGGAGASASAPRGDAPLADAALDEAVVGDVVDAELDAMISDSAGTSAELVERTEDLRRLKAEYDNYRRRVERDRAGWGELAVAKLVGDLLPALDDVDRARAHGEIDGAFRAVADHLEKVVSASGLTRFGQVGDSFDPARHEALTSIPTPDIDAEQVIEVYRAGYEFAGRVLRAAQVVVGTPA